MSKLVQYDERKPYNESYHGSHVPPLFACETQVHSLLPFREALAEETEASSVSGWECARSPKERGR